MRTRLHLMALVAAGAMALAACGGGGEDTTEPAPATDASAPATTDTSSAPAASDLLMLTAPEGSANTGFAETELTAPADTPFTIHFVNDDPGIPHNVQIFEGTDTSADPVWAPEGDPPTITGPDEVDYEVPALPAGSYLYNCLVHVTTMVGTLTVQ